jgi:hypothetical protein
MALLSTLIDEKKAGRCRIRRSENLKDLKKLAQTFSLDRLDATAATLDVPLQMQVL